MKRETMKIAVAFALTVLLTGNVHAALGDNTGTGDVGGVGGALLDSPVFNLTSTGNVLNLQKRAFQADGTPIPTGSVLPTGSVVKFMIYVSNDSTVGINDVSVQDVLDTAVGAFSYTLESIQIDNTAANCAGAVCTTGPGSEEEAIYTAVNAATGTCGAVPSACTDASDADVASWDGTNTIDIGDSVNAGNAQLDIAASKTFAVLFTVTMN